MGDAIIAMRTAILVIESLREKKLRRGGFHYQTANCPLPGKGDFISTMGCLIGKPSCIYFHQYSIFSNDKYTVDS